MSVAMVRRAHHIDFVVRDLDSAVERYASILGVDPLPREKLEDRGVELVRFEVGNLWIILVQPVRDDSPVQAFLDQHGEGFFHIAYQVDDVEGLAARLEDEGIRLVNRVPRLGVEGWKLVDIEMGETFGVYTQLVEEDGD
jgi:methylmalonyl-CoA/ethylmalonyl-CoA epimerase